MDSKGESSRTDAAEARSSSKRKAEVLESDKGSSSNSNQPQGDAATGSDIQDHGFRPNMPRNELPLELPPNNSRRVKPGSSI